MKPDALVIEIAELGPRHEELLDRLRAGEQLVLADHGTPVAKVSPTEASRRIPKLGTLKGLIRISEDFDAPLPAEIVAEFYK